MDKINGQCLCGAVTITALTDHSNMRACHCDMCRRHTSSMFISVATDQASIKVNGPAKTFQSSEWAERAFCEVCGSTLWYGTPGDGARNLAAGLFDNGADTEMQIEFFNDRCPTGYALAGDHKKLTTQQTMALFAPQEDDTQ